ncbi:MAG: hypothetical protein Q7T11_08305, partial [Deltaproteobacteria bacterium]|nr:hypothetical protein [Deltaproteobacteria bacterium]
LEALSHEILSFMTQSGKTGLSAVFVPGADALVIGPSSLSHYQIAINGGADQPFLHKQIARVAILQEEGRLIFKFPPETPYDSVEARRQAQERFVDFFAGIPLDSIRALAREPEHLVPGTSGSSGHVSGNEDLQVGLPSPPIVGGSSDDGATKALLGGGAIYAGRGTPQAEADQILSRAVPHFSSEATVLAPAVSILTMPAPAPKKKAEESGSRRHLRAPHRFGVIPGSGLPSRSGKLPSPLALRLVKG